jgi:hypothetical protein
MAYKIENNNFTKDVIGVRSLRLSMVSKHITNFVKETQIPNELVSWGMGAFEDFMALIAGQSNQKIAKQKKVAQYQSQIDELYDKYKYIKNILIASYSGDTNEIEGYGINAAIPKTYDEILERSRILLSYHNTKIRITGNQSLPDAIIQPFETVFSSACELKVQSEKSKEDLKTATLRLKKKFTEDSARLRTLYSWLIAFWGERDIRLATLGFYIFEGSNGVAYDNGINLNYDPQRKEFTWDSIDAANGYQLAYSTDGKEWKIAYYGTDSIVPYYLVKGKTQFKVRAKRGKDFSNWSHVVEVLPTV